MNDGNVSRPELTAHRATARAREGFAVEVDVGGFVVRADMPQARGGANSAPTPGNVMRAAVAACLVMGYKIWATELGVAIADVEVDFATEIDMRGQSGAAEVPAGWQALRWHVRLTSQASDAEIERVLAQAERLSPMLDSLHSRCTRVRTFEVRRGA